MLKKYIVRLTDEERNTLQQVTDKFKGSSQKVRRAQVLLKADADGPGWIDAEIAAAFGCRTRTAENIRERFVSEGCREKAVPMIVVREDGGISQGLGGSRAVARDAPPRQAHRQAAHKVRPVGRLLVEEAAALAA